MFSLSSAPEPLATSGHALADRLAGSGGYATLDGNVVSIRRRDGFVLLEMTPETWRKLGGSFGGSNAESVL